MTRKLRAGTFAGLTATAVILGTLTAAPAHATTEIKFFECNNPIYVPDYFKIRIGTGPDSPKRCFANAGDFDGNQDDVTAFTSGNNAGYFEYEPGDGWRYRHTFNKGETIDDPNHYYGHIDNLHIN